MDNIKYYITFIATISASFLGGWDAQLKFLVFLIVADYITGVAKAIVQRNLSSNIGFRGIIKKICIFLVIATATQLDLLIGQDTHVIRSIAVFAYISNEGISMIENLTALGVPVPAVIRGSLLKFKSKE